MIYSLNEVFLSLQEDHNGWSGPYKSERQISLSDFDETNVESFCDLLDDAAENPTEFGELFDWVFDKLIESDRENLAENVKSIIKENVDLVWRQELKDVINRELPT